MQLYETQINKVQIPDKIDMSEVDLIIHNLTSLPEEYEVTIIVLKDRLMDLSAEAKLRFKMVQEKIILCHNCIKQHKKDVSYKQAYTAFNN